MLSRWRSCPCPVGVNFPNRSDACSGEPAVFGPENLSGDFFFLHVESNDAVVGIQGKQLAAAESRCARSIAIDVSRRERTKRKGNVLLVPNREPSF